jgi:lipopolysaccharide transport system ATP-binding protein
MGVAIRFENVSKQYRLGEIGTGTISRDLERAWAKFRGRPDPFALVGATGDREIAGDDYVWAVKDLSLDVHKGEVLGVIGRNGAGKSTLLKLLSRVTAPTRGVIKVKGTIASLLEVGTGFHPELTGRENIDLNGVILGMKRSEIRRRLDEIVEFSGCAKYIDTPVKRYSSGMVVRLGFSVAAHLDCETLIVDEVLAVGDIDFQQRCIQKMQDVSASGRTILLVSHNMGTLARLCNRCAILNLGRLDFLGNTSAAIDRYLLENSQLPATAELSDVEQRSGSGRARFRQFWMEDSEGTPCHSVASGDTASLCFTLCRTGDPVEHVDVGFSIHQINGEIVTGMYSSVSGTEYSIADNELTVRCRIERLPLPPGRYTVAMRLVARTEELDWPRGKVAAFDVVEGDFYQSGRPNPLDGVKFLVTGNWSAGER